MDGLYARLASSLIQIIETVLIIAAAAMIFLARRKAATQQPSGFRSAVAALDAQTFLAVGTDGSDLSQDAGVRWKAFASQSFNALFALDAQHIFAAGPKGVIAQFVAESK